MNLKKEQTLEKDIKKEKEFENLEKEKKDEKNAIEKDIKKEKEVEKNEKVNGDIMKENENKEDKEVHNISFNEEIDIIEKQENKNETMENDEKERDVNLENKKGNLTISEEIKGKEISQKESFIQMRKIEDIKNNKNLIINEENELNSNNQNELKNFQKSKYKFPTANSNGSNRFIK